MRESVRGKCTLNVEMIEDDNNKVLCLILYFNFHTKECVFFFWSYSYSRAFQCSSRSFT